MKIACYARKSIYSDKSDSVDSQTRLCREYIEQNFDDAVESFTVYCDEGFTGANTSRPDFARMMNDIDLGGVDVLIVYQLDRLSRDVRDFSNIYKILEEKSVKFVSVKEKIDTVSPMGKAMMYVTMVFAQMERETIAQRVSDNMMSLAMKGFWCGGKPPLGYKTGDVTVDGKRHVMLVPDSENSKYVADVFREFVDGRHTLTSIFRTYIRRGQKGPTGYYFTTTRFYDTLTNPCYAPATREIYEFFAGKGCQMVDDKDRWDGTHGIMAYRRRSNRQRQPYSEWIILSGMHEPIVDADTWLQAQSQMHKNIRLKNGSHEPSLLKGVLRCGKCGTLMFTQWNRNRDGSPRCSYSCNKRKLYGKSCCDMRSIKCYELDDRVMDVFRRISVDDTVIRKYVMESDFSEDSSSVIRELESKIAGLQKKIRKLSEAIEDASGSSAVKYIIKQIESYDDEIKEASAQLSQTRARSEAQKSAKDGINEKCRKISMMMDGFDGFGATERNEIVKDVLSSCVWNGETLEIRF